MRLRRRDLLLAFAFMAATPALAKRGRGRGGRDDDDHHDDDHHGYDHELADKARRSGDIKPLREVLEAVKRNYEGEIVGILFGKEDGIWVYEIKMLLRDDRYIEVYVDARTAMIIKVEGK